MTGIDRELLMAVLVRMGELAEEEGVKLEICVYGGSAMMLAYDAWSITKDVDAVVHPSDIGFRLADKAGREFGLPEAWLNDDVRQFLAPFEQVRRLPWDAPGITITAPTAGYLLAMKALACRQPLPGYEGDLDDLRFLVKKMNIKAVDEIQEHIDRYYPNDVISKEDTLVLDHLIKGVNR